MSFFETYISMKKSSSKKLHVISDDELCELQKISLDIAKDIIGICNEEGIPYMLGGGSALGAVRHNGFIPWDDDLDMNVPREHIDKLTKAISAKYKDKYYIEIPGKTKDYWSSFIQIHKKGTIYKEYNWQKDEHAGIKIDIFPIENTYDGLLKRVFHGIRVEAGLLAVSCYRFYLWKDDYEEIASGSKKMKFAVMVKSTIGRLISRDASKIYKRLQDTMSEYKNTGSRYVTMPTGRRHFFGELYTRRTFMQLRQVDFEGEKFTVTGDYDNYLTRLYGDYMSLPQKQNRERHMVVSLDLNEG
ncbi:MAG: LicD family protein [Lachnospiraceae bacterium]|nr:LicD family protein [Lachnospiraceae bacterium]